MGYYGVKKSTWKSESNKINDLTSLTDIVEKCFDEINSKYDSIKFMASHSTCSLDWKPSDSNVNTLKNNSNYLLWYANAVYNEIGKKDLKFGYDLNHAIEAFSVIDINSIKVNNNIGVSVLRRDKSTKRMIRVPLADIGLEDILNSNNDILQEMNKRFEKDVNESYNFRSKFENEIMKSNTEDFINTFILKRFGISDARIALTGSDPFGEKASNTQRVIAGINTLSWGVPILKGANAAKTAGSAAKSYVSGVTTDYTLEGMDKNSDKKMSEAERYIKGIILDSGLGKLFEGIK